MLDNHEAAFKSIGKVDAFMHVTAELASQGEDVAKWLDLHPEQQKAATDALAHIRSYITYACALDQWCGLIGNVIKQNPEMEKMKARILS